MEAITKFKAKDGIEFVSEQECVEYELLIDEVNSIMSSLPNRPDGSDFANGSGYVQHDKTILQRVRLRLLFVCQRYIDHKWIQQTINNENVHPSYVGRLIDEYGINPLSKAWYRFLCMDSNSREWGQPYFATNPDSAKQVRLS